jgi:hypothetical protein
MPLVENMTLVSEAEEKLCIYIYIYIYIHTQYARRGIQVCSNN